MVPIMTQLKWHNLESYTNLIGMNDVDQNSLGLHGQ